MHHYDLEFDTEGVWVSRIEDAGKASLAGIDVSDLILRINDENIKDLEDFSEIAGVEYLLIDQDTSISSFKKELRWNDLYYHLAKGI